MLETYFIKNTENNLARGSTYVGNIKNVYF